MSNKHFFALIMAGGSGTRFWPASRYHRPKQLLPLGKSGKSLLQDTLDRIEEVIPPDRTLIVTAEHLQKAIQAQLPQISEHNILAEPAPRNTAPCVGWGAAQIQRRDPEAIVAVLPADQHIANEKEFRRCLTLALHSAESGTIATIGLPPSRPETGFGYIEATRELSDGVLLVDRFVEKPDLETAKDYMTSGRFFWNSGMFFFRTSTLLQEVREHLPNLASTLDAFDKAAIQGNEKEIVKTLFPKLQSISIDHGIMENARSIVCVPGDFGWSDVGSWLSAWELASQDKNGNAATQDTVLVDAHGCYVHAPSAKTVALLGVHDLVVVDTEDALLIMPKHRSQEVRTIVDKLREQKNDRVL